MIVIIRFLKQYSVVLFVAFGYSGVIMMLISVNSAHVMGDYLMNFYPFVTFDDVLDILCPSVDNHTKSYHMSSFVSKDLSDGVPEIYYWCFTGDKLCDDADLVEFLYFAGCLCFWVSTHATEDRVLFVDMNVLVSQILPTPLIHLKFFNPLWSSNLCDSLCTSSIVLLMLSINGFPNDYNK
jgi:hypothetical protein